MLKKAIVTLGLLLLTTAASYAQNFGLQSLFRPGLRLGTTYAFDSDINDTLSFGMTKYRMGLVVPLSGGLSLDLKNLKASVKQDFLTVNAGFRDIRMDGLLSSPHVYSFTAGVTGIRAGTNNGIWGYTVNAGIVQDLEFSSSNNLFFLAGAVKLKIHGLHKQNYYGLIAVYNGGRFLPVPILGIRRKLFDGAHLNVLLPAQVDITYKPVDDVKMTLKSSIGGFRNWTRVDTSKAIFSELNDTDQAILGFANLTHSLEIEYKVSGNTRIILDGGVYAPARVSFNKDVRNDYHAFDPTVVPFVRIAIKFNLGKSLIGSHMFGNDF